MSSLNRLLTLCILFFLLCGCSSLSFTRHSKPFDGTVHAASSLICAAYWSNHGFQNKPGNKTTAQRILPTLGLTLYSALDLVSSLLLDIVVFPVQAMGGGPAVAAFDQVPHALLPCGKIENSINTVGAL